MIVITDKLTHDQARTIEGKMIRDRINDYEEKGLVTGREKTVLEKLKKSLIDNNNRGRVEERWLDLEIDDFIITNGDPIPIKK